ncbi:MAG: ATP-binding protein [Acidobacteriota bacterium]
MTETSSISEGPPEGPKELPDEVGSGTPLPFKGEKFGFTLGRWFFLWMLLVAILALGSTLAVVLAAQSEDLRERLDFRGRSAIRAASSGNWEGDAGVVLVTALPELVAAEVRDDTGRLVWQYGPFEEVRQDARSRTVRVSETTQVRGRSPETGLHIELMLSTTQIQRHVLRTGARLALTLCLVLALGMVGGMILINRVVEPLRLVAESVGSFDPGSPSETPPVAGAGREVRELAGAFTRMRERLVVQRRALSASERRFRELFESSPVALLELDRQGCIIGANPASGDLIGESAAGEAGLQSLEEFLPMTRALLERLGDSEGSLTADGLWRMPDGGDREVELHLQSVIGGGRSASLLAVRDLSDRLRRLGERWQRTLDEMDEGVALLDGAGLPIQSNRAFEAFAKHVLPGVSGRKGGGRRIEWKQEAGDRSLRCVIAQLSEGGERVLVVRDQTDWLRAEEQLREGRTMEAVATLASGVAHDFNNLLAGILLHVRILQKDPSARAEAAETIGSLAEEGAEVVKGLLDFANPDPGPRGVVDLVALVKDQEKLLRHMLPDDVGLECSLPGGTAEVFGNGGDLRRILLNLVLNARDAFGGDAGRIDIEVSRSDSAAVLAVSDDGPGVPSAIRGRIFEPFFSLRREGRGAGLGLAVTFALVEEHDGTITYEPAEDGGARFIVRLPLVG